MPAPGAVPSCDSHRGQAEGPAGDGSHPAAADAVGKVSPRLCGTFLRAPRGLREGLRSRMSTMCHALAAGCVQNFVQGSAFVWAALSSDGMAAGYWQTGSLCHMSQARHRAWRKGQSCRGGQVNCLQPALNLRAEFGIPQVGLKSPDRRSLRRWPTARKRLGRPRRCFHLDAAQHLMCRDGMRDPSTRNPDSLSADWIATWMAGAVKPAVLVNVSSRCGAEFEPGQVRRVYPSA